MPGESKGCPDQSHEDCFWQKSRGSEEDSRGKSSLGRTLQDTGWPEAQTELQREAPRQMLGARGVPHRGKLLANAQSAQVSVSPTHLPLLARPIKPDGDLSPMSHLCLLPKGPVFQEDDSDFPSDSTEKLLRRSFLRHSTGVNTRPIWSQGSGKTSP